MRLIRLDSNKDHFRSFDFRDGLNIVVAERTESSTETDSRNGVGKTTLFQIIDFCLGGSVKESDSLYKLRGADWEFTLTLGFEGKRQLSVTRSLDDSSAVLLAGSVAELGVAEASPASIGPRAWTSWLGEHCFQLESSGATETYAPTFRRLFGHFLRFRSDAYVSPFEVFSKQPPYQMQSDNAFLLGLEWRLAVEWQHLKDRAKALGSLGHQDLDALGEQLGELESQRVRAETRSRRLAEQIRDFEVLPEYRAVEERANLVTSEMQTLANKTTMNARLLTLYQSQIATEGSDDSVNVIATFEEAGVILGDALKQSIDAIVQFHEQVAANRKTFLAMEISRLEREQADTRAALERLEATRREDLQLLATHGALDDFAQLQQRLGSAVAEYEALQHRIDDLREIKRGKAAIKVSQADLQQRTDLDLEQRLSSISDILSDFSETFEDAYDAPADLAINVGDAGYQFRVSLPRQGSHGVGKVGVFAYDLAVTNAWAQRNSGTGFLGHDSVILDGVDERQKSAAILRALRSAESHGFQYLLTVNSDDLPTAELAAHGVDISDYLVLTLTDSDPTGGLLGTRI